MMPIASANTIAHCTIDRLTIWNILSKNGTRHITTVSNIPAANDIINNLFLNGLDLNIEPLVLTLNIWNNCMKLSVKNAIVVATAVLWKANVPIKYADMDNAVTNIP